MLTFVVYCYIFVENFLSMNSDKKNKTHFITISATEDFHNEVKKEANKVSRTVSSFIRYVVAEYLKNKK